MIGVIDALLWTLVAVISGVGSWVIVGEIAIAEASIAARPPDRWLWYAEPVYLGQE